MVGLDVVDVAVGHLDEFRAQVFEAEEVGVEAAPSDLVASRLCHYGVAEASEQCSYHHDGAAQLRAFPDEVVALQECQVQGVGLIGEGVVAQADDLHADILHESVEVAHVEDVGHIADGHHVAGEQGGTDHLQGLVLGALWLDSAAQQAASFNDK